MPSKPQAWPAEITENLDEILGGIDLLVSISTIGLQALEKGNPVSVRVLILEHLEDALIVLDKHINIIIDHYTSKGGRPVKWVKMAQEFQEKHLYNFLIYQERLVECYRDANWECVELYLTNLPYLCYDLKQKVEAIPREAYILEESRKILSEALNRD